MSRIDAPALVGVVGAGTMGAGIAQVAARAGHRVVLVDEVPGRAEQAVARVGTALDRLVQRGRLAPDDGAAARVRLGAATSVSELARCAIVVEAVVEALDVKRDLFRALEEVVGSGCVLATNTSSLSVTDLAAGLRHPGRFLGLHFFNPAPAMPLVEVVSGRATDPMTARAVADLAAAWGKTPVLVTSSPGFIVNRVARPFYGEGLRAVEEGVADPVTVDAVLREAGGFRMGPLELTDLIGQDVNLAVTRTVWEQLDRASRYAPTATQEELVEAGRLGRKSGHGFYRYTDDSPDEARGAPPEAEARDSATAGRVPAPPTHVDVFGDWGPWSGLWDRLSSQGVEVRRGQGSSAGAPDDPHALVGGGVLVPTDGRCATERAAELGVPVTVLDLVLDPLSTGRFAVATSDTASPAHRAAMGLLRSTGATVSVVGDSPGLLVARTVAMLVDEAVRVVTQAVASAADVDTAMRLGVGYPLGPLEWGDRIGAWRVAAVLDALGRSRPGGGYEPCPALRRAALTGRSLREL